MGFPLLARATASYQNADPDKAAVDGVSTTVETHTADNAYHSFDDLDQQ
jgi:hypothetical protein